MFKAGDKIKINGEFVLGSDLMTEDVFDIRGRLFTDSQLRALDAVKVRKSYTNEELEEEYRRFEVDRLRSVARWALILMKEDNKRSRPECLYMAMGYKKDSEKENTWYKVGEE